jgi:hypothetical protein
VSDSVFVIGYLLLQLLIVLTPQHSHPTDAYKKQLEDILNEIILISEIAELSIESETIATLMGLQRENFDVAPPSEINPATQAKTSSMPKVQWSHLKFDGDTSTKSSWGMVDDDDDGEPSQINFNNAEGTRIAKEGCTYESSSRLPIKDLLDKWEEPLSKHDQVNSTKTLPLHGLVVSILMVYILLY